MKLPSTNYGIVTRFDIHTYPSSGIWGALSVYPGIRSTVTELYAQSEKLGHDDTNKADMMVVAMVREKGTSVVMAVQVNSDSIPREPLTSASPIMRLETSGSTHKVINEVVDSALAASTRAKWYTITTKIDTDYFWDTYLKGEQIMKDLETRENLLWTIVVQHFQKSFVEVAKQSPFFNALAQGKDDLVSE